MKMYMYFFLKKYISKYTPYKNNKRNYEISSIKKSYERSMIYDYGINSFILFKDRHYCVHPAKLLVHLPVIS